MTTDAALTSAKCEQCSDADAAYYDTVSERPLCSNCAKEAALDRMHDDGEIQSLDQYLRHNPGTVQ